MVSAGQRYDPTAVPSRIRNLARETGLGDYEQTWSDSAPFRRAATTLWLFGAGVVVEAHTEGRIHVCSWAGSRLSYKKECDRNVGPAADFTIHHETGAKIRRRFQDLDFSELLDRMIDGVTTAQLPRARSAVERGLRVDFGPVQMDLENLYLERGHVPWNRVISVRKVLGYVAVKRIDKFWTTFVDSGRITDVHVLLKVAGELCHGPFY